MKIREKREAEKLRRWEDGKKGEENKATAAILIKSFWKSVTAETFFQKGFWPPEAKVTVDLGHFLRVEIFFHLW